MTNPALQPNSARSEDREAETEKRAAKSPAVTIQPCQFRYLPEQRHLPTLKSFFISWSPHPERTRIVILRFPLGIRRMSNDLAEQAPGNQLQPARTSRPCLWMMNDRACVARREKLVRPPAGLAEPGQALARPDCHMGKKKSTWRRCSVIPAGASASGCLKARQHAHQFGWRSVRKV